MDEQTGVVSLAGDIALHQDAPVVHAHAMLSTVDGSAWGGHLMFGTVRPTLEVTLTETPVHLLRRVDPESGLPLIQL